MGARNPGARQAPPDEIESAAEIAAMNERAGEAAERFAASQDQPSGEPGPDDVRPGDEAAMDARLAAIIKTVEGARFERGSLVDGVRDALLEIFRHRPRAWSQMSNDEQKDLAKFLDHAAQVLVRRVAQVVAEGDLDSVHAKLETYSAKDGFKITLKALDDAETAAALYRMFGHEVVVTSADLSKFSAGTTVKTDPDQPDLPMDESAAAQPPADDSDLDSSADEGGDKAEGDD